LIRSSLYVGLVCAFLVASATGARAQLMNATDVTLAKAAFQAIAAGKWKEAELAAASVRDPLFAKIVRWIDYERPDTRASFAAIVGFIERNPTWPGQKNLLSNAEEAMMRGASDTAVLDWFDIHTAESAAGLQRLGAVLLASGKTVEARTVLRQAWVEGNFTKRREKSFYNRYRRYLTLGDHVSRLDRLIWEGRNWPARRMLWKVAADQRALAQARLMLMRNKGNVDQAIAQVPPHLKDDPGLVYERLRWRRRKGLDLSAREMLAQAPKHPARADKWWIERSVLARNALRDGHVSEAYRIVRDHSLEAGADFAEAEWLAGWIALRFLGDHKEALGHFVTLFQAVRYPISRARGAYWAGRASETLNAPKLTRQWYGEAALYPTTYYGQLARARLQPGQGLLLPSDAKPSETETAIFADDELARAVRLLIEAGQRERLRRFILALGEVSDSPGWKVLTASLARARGRPDLSIAVAKKATQKGAGFIADGYPTLTPPLYPKVARSAVEMPLLLAVVRQESAFNSQAVSPAGARGLMQLMPQTALQVSQELKLNYSSQRLTMEPNLNLKLGQAYLAGLLDRFDGSYVLTLAAYNAGPARARQWLRRNGDPREAEVDAIDWVEAIPFNETRNYVQRVMENLQVYRARLNNTAVALTPEHDLGR
jgi:soluble lytic murein transglycosylase